MMTLKSCATRTGLGAAARQSATYFKSWSVDVTSAGVVSVSGYADVTAPVLNGTGFVGAALSLTSAAANDLTITWAIAGGLAVASRIAGLLEIVEVLGN